MTDAQKTGIVFNIQKFSVHDGDGIRTLVFLKGCPLHCRWCSNPESQRMQPEHAFNPTRCLTAEVCGRCVKACTHDGLKVIDGLIAFNPNACVECMECLRACPSGAQTLYGESMTVKQVLDKVDEDGVFYHRSGGGMTLSGGESLMQADFALALLREAKKRFINTTIETCGCYAYETLHEACGLLDKLIFDIKCADAEKHKKHTGVDNTLILENFKKICADFPDLPIRVRTPVIPGFNNTEEDIRAIRALVPHEARIEYELLAYHRMGQPKYGYLGRVYALEGAELDDALFARLRSIAAQ